LRQGREQINHLSLNFNRAHMNVRDYFSEEEKLQIIQAIRTAEVTTSGEIRVHIEKKCSINVLDRATYIFEKVDMHKTRLRNGVLFYLAVEDKKFAILGDAGIHQKVTEDFWEEIKNEMARKFAEGKFAEGLVAGIKKAGEQLSLHFPWQKDDMNELSDEISFG